MPLLRLLCILFHISFIHSSRDHTTNGTLINVPLCKESGLKCADDCLTLLVCEENNTEPLTTVFCPEKSLAKPYCSNNECSSTSETCPTTSVSIFQCSGDGGVFPDPNDCTRYRKCKDVEILASYYQCPPGYNFNSKNGLCDKTATCEIINCTESNQAILFQSNPRFYAFCHKSVSGRIEGAVYKCSANLVFSLTAYTCIYHCESSGAFKDVINCHAYFVCSGTVGNFKWKRLICPPKQFFNGTDCVAELSPCSSVLLSSVIDNATSLDTSSAPATYSHIISADGLNITDPDPTSPILETVVSHIPPTNNENSHS